MKTLYLDCYSGISGDMTVGALIDAGASAQAVIEALNSLATGATYEAEKTIRGGVTGSKFRVHVPPDLPAKHRHLHHIVDMIEKADLAARAKTNAIAVFTKLGEAEAGVHGVEIKKVHFHEVGAVDALEAIIDQRVDVAVRQRVDASAATAITAVGAAARHELLTAKAGDTIAALAGVDLDHGFVDEFHGSCDKKIATKKPCQRHGFLPQRNQFTPVSR